MDLKNAKVYEGAPEGKPSTTLTIADEDFMLMAQGKLQPQAAFMKGKVEDHRKYYVGSEIGSHT
jgi:putative sterol carrier protein